MTVGHGIIAIATPQLGIRRESEKGSGRALPQPSFQTVERVLPAEGGANLFRRLLQLSRELLEVLVEVLFGGLDLLLLGNGLEQEITFHFQKRSLPQLLAHRV